MITKKNVSLLMHGRYAGTETNARQYFKFKKGKRLKDMHAHACVNACPHFVTTLNQDPDLHRSRLEGGSFCKEVMASNP